MVDAVIFQKMMDEFNKAEGYFPHKAVDQALQQEKEAIIPYLLALLEDVAENYSKIDFFRMDYIFALFLLAKFKEPQTFPIIIKFAMLPDEWSKQLLGDCIKENLPQLILSTYNGHLSPIKAIIENIYIDTFVREAALRSLLGLVAASIVSRDEVVSYLEKLFQSSLTKNNSLFTAMLIDTSNSLWPEELYSYITKEFDNGNVDKFYIDRESVENRLQLGKEACLQKYLYTHTRQIENIYDELQYMQIFAPKKISPNEQCPCDSGKKYKKCCFVQYLINSKPALENLTEIF